jgi:hypothetical protein
MTQFQYCAFEEGDLAQELPYFPQIDPVRHGYDLGLRRRQGGDDVGDLPPEPAALRVSCPFQDGRERGAVPDTAQPKVDVSRHGGGFRSW